MHRIMRCIGGMMAPTALLLVFALCSVLGAEDQSQCEPFAGKPLPCSPYVNYPLYVPSNLDQTHLAASVALDVQRGLLAPRSCAATLVAFTCSSTFHKCTTIKVEDEVYVLEAPMCRSFCRQLNSDCAGALMLAGQEQYNCSALRRDGTPVYPIGETNVTVGVNGTNISIPCLSIHDTQKSEADCPKHFSAVPEFNPSKDWAPCKPSCPLEVYSDSEYNGLSVTQIILGVLGVLINAFALVVYLTPYDPERRHWPAIIPMFWNIALIGVSVGMIWPMFFGGFSNVTCQDDEISSSNQSDLDCALQGSILFWFGGVLILHWMVTCIYLASTTMRDYDDKLKARLEVAFHAVSWVTPTILLLLALIGFQIGAGRTSVNCFVLSTYDSSSVWWSVGLVGLPLSIIFAIGTSACCLFSCNVLRARRFSHHWNEHGRLSIAAGVVPLLMCCAVVYWWILAVYQPSYETNYDRWFNCVAENFYLSRQNSTGSHIHHCGDPIRDPYGAAFLMGTGISFMPLLIGLILACGWRTINTWISLVLSVVCCVAAVQDVPRHLGIAHSLPFLPLPTRTHTDGGSEEDDEATLARAREQLRRGSFNDLSDVDSANSLEAFGIEFEDDEDSSIDMDEQDA